LRRLTQSAKQAFPNVYVKSRERQLGSARVIRVTLSARAPDATALASLLDPATDQLLTTIAAAGFAVARVEDDGDNVITPSARS